MPIDSPVLPIDSPAAPNDSQVEVEYGGVYVACGPSPRLDEICDRGAIATDPEDGVLTR